MVEQYWMDRLKPTYNLAPFACSGVWSELRKKLNRLELGCLRYFTKKGWVFHYAGLEIYAWDACDSILAVFDIEDGESYRRSHAQPDYVLASRKAKNQTQRYVLVGKAPSLPVCGDWDDD